MLKNYVHSKRKKKKSNVCFFSFLKLIILPTTPCPPYWKNSNPLVVSPFKNILKQNPMLFYLNSLSDNSLSPPPILRYIFVKNTGFFKKSFCFLFCKKHNFSLVFKLFFFFGIVHVKKNQRKIQATRSKNEVIFLLQVIPIPGKKASRTWKISNDLVILKFFLHEVRFGKKIKDWVMCNVFLQLLLHLW